MMNKPVVLEMVNTKYISVNKNTTIRVRGPFIDPKGREMIFTLRPGDFLIQCTRRNGEILEGYKRVVLANENAAYDVTFQTENHEPVCTMTMPAAIIKEFYSKRTHY